MRFFGSGLGSFIRAMRYYQRDRSLERRQRDAQFSAELFKARARANNPKPSTNVWPFYPEDSAYYQPTPPPKKG